MAGARKKTVLLAFISSGVNVVTPVVRRKDLDDEEQDWESKEVSPDVRSRKRKGALEKAEDIDKDILNFIPCAKHEYQYQAP